MRVYQLKHYEVLLNDRQASESALLYHYEQLCGRLLTMEALANSNAIEIAHLANSRMEQRPARILRLLSAKTIQPFCFITAKN